jgi:hypothetical protein
MEGPEAKEGQAEVISDLEGRERSAPQDVVMSIRLEHPQIGLLLSFPRTQLRSPLLLVVEPCRWKAC